MAVTAVLAMNALMHYTNSSLIPSPRDLVLVLPRLAQRAGTFAFYTVEQIDSLVGRMKAGSGSIIAERTASERVNATGSHLTRAAMEASSKLGLGGTAAATAAQVSSTPQAVLQDSFWNLQTIRNLGGLFGYLMTRWALGTFLVAIILNRTQFYASSRTPLRFGWLTRLALYIVPILLLASQAIQVLQAIRCQSSPAWALMRYGDAEKNISMDYAGEGGILYRIASGVLFWQSEAESCAAIDMARATPDTRLLELSGSLTLLWPLFLTVCFSRFFEVLACALQGRQPMADSGMTIFEHSLAFCEAEAMLVKPWELAGKVADTGTAFAAEASDRLVTRAFLKGFMNVPPEVLVICLISAVSHLSSNILSVLDKRRQCRLVNTSVWALSYMAAFVWSVYRFFNMDAASTSTAIGLGLIRFPTVCIVGFIPHLVILCGILVCACVYGLAFLVTVVSPPPHGPQPTSIRERFSIAYQNLQANVHLSAGTPIRIAWQDDFYATLLKVGFAILTSASEAVFLNEGIQIRVSATTWLEKKRYDEIVKRRGLLYKRTVESIPHDLRRPTVNVAAGPSNGGQAEMYPALTASGFAVERKSKSRPDGADVTYTATFNDRGVGFMQRHWRWAMSIQFFKGIFWLAVSLNARCVMFILDKVGVRRYPELLSRLAGPRPSRKSTARHHAGSQERGQDGLQFWMIGEDGSLQLPDNNDVDVEREMRRRIEMSNAPGQSDAERDALLNDQTYNWWKAGGWWGEIDTSGDYTAASTEDDDTTSMISFATTASEADEDWHTDDEGRRTPTQENPYIFSREATPSADRPLNDALDSAHLAELLDPQSIEQRDEARVLARHLRNESGPLTRSRYNRQVDLERSRIFTSSTRQRSNFDAQLSAEEEEKGLERFILQQRASTGEKTGNGGWQGALCVVCQHNPRTILAWPCGCLSVCDECRIGLASRNYSSCICCRTGVSAFSRVWVP